MPVPTDTFWNIKRLNWVFAGSAVLLVATIGASVLQDFEKDWRKPQMAGKVWEAALVQDKVERESTEQLQARLARLNTDIESAERQVAADPRHAELTAEIKSLADRQTDLEFSYNNLKAEVTVADTAIQDARTTGDADRAAAIEHDVADRRARASAWAEDLFRLKTEREAKREQLAAITEPLDELVKERTKLTADIDALRKKQRLLVPDTLVGKLGTAVRRAPLAQFINPAERVQQVVLPDVQTDVSFMKITTVDRCTTCHVNIAKPEFGESNVLAYLEREAAKARGVVLPEQPESKTAPPATRLAPGAVAMIEFWHAWARELAPAVLAGKGDPTARLNTLGKSVGKAATVTLAGKPVDAFAFLPDPKKAEDAASVAMTDAQRDAIATALLNAWYTYDPARGSTATRGDATVTLASGLDEKTIKPNRTAALQYADELRSAVLDALPDETEATLRDQYRRRLTTVVNAARDDAGAQPLDPSPALLAHPNLDLYVDVDSKHPFEAVGCTSCHDGSGLETNFVLAAHMGNPIWVDDENGQPVLPQQLRIEKTHNGHAGGDDAHAHGATMASMLDVVAPHGEIAPTHADDLHLHPTSHADAHAAPGDYADAVATKPVSYVDPVTGKTAKAVPQLKHWADRYELEAGRSLALVYHEWDRPMLPAKYMEANCVRCHTEAHDIRETAPTVHQGRSLFANMGCVNCHQMDSIKADTVPEGADARFVTANGQRKVGTDLRHVTGKLSPEFINTWVWAPKAFRPSTKMPHFFMLENNSSDEEIRRTRQEARAITEYLVQTATPLETKHAIPAALLSSGSSPDSRITDGKKLFNTVGCLACHTNLNDVVSGTGDKAVTVARKWISDDLVKTGKAERSLRAKDSNVDPKDLSKRVREEAGALYDGMSYNERQLYVVEQFEPMPGMDAPQTYPDGSLKPIFMHHGPELSGVGTKLTAGRSPEQAKQWLYDWLKEPQHYSEYTVMPRLRLTDEQALALTEYLLAQERTNDRKDDGWTAGLAAPDGEKLSELTSLFLRSQFSIATAYEKAKDDAAMTERAADAITTADLPRDAAKQRVASFSLEQKQMVFLGKKLIGHYGCMSCHAINGAESITSPCANLSDWGQKQVSKLDFGFLDPHKAHGLPPAEIPMVNGLAVEAATLAHSDVDWATRDLAKPVEAAYPVVHHSRADWIEQKLRNTRIYDRGKVLLEPLTKVDGGKHVVTDPGKPYDKIKMPTFYLNDAQVHAITTFVLSNRDRLVSDRLMARSVTEDDRQIARGRMLAEKYNCVGCHAIDGNHAPVQQYYKREELATAAPPSLRGEGNKVQHEWLHGFLRNVVPLRPLLTDGIRMPSFPLTPEETTDIAAYFAATSNKESAVLAKYISAIDGYVAMRKASAAAASATQPTDPKQAWPGDDWYTLPTLAKARAFLESWALANGQIKPIEIDPAKQTPTQLGVGYRTILYKAKFVTALYDTPYPFTGDAVEQPAPERFALGEQFFLRELQCLSCHYLGDPAPGAVPKAPNLNLTHERLQRRWTRAWVQEPPVIQVGTSMPQFFSGLPVFDPHGQTWAAAQGLPKEKVDETDRLYGRTVDEQTDLLLDFLYAAGERGHTSVPLAPQAQPAPPVTPTTAPAAQ